VTETQETPAFQLAYVPGVTPAKWVRVWHERMPEVPLTLLQVSAAEAAATLLDGGADAGLVRLPVDRTSLSAIPLYTETTVVVVPKDHRLAAVAEISPAELDQEIVLHPMDDTLGWEKPPGQPAFERPATTSDAVELVAAGIGVLVVPQSLARLHHRRDLTYRPLADAPQSQVALSWMQDRTTDQVEEFIGIVRGRTVNSTRGRSAAATAERSPKKTSDRKNSDKSGATRKSADPKSPDKQTSDKKGAAGAGARSAAKPGPRAGGRPNSRSGSQTGRRGKPRRRS
jgi:hypothetical protein